MIHVEIQRGGSWVQSDTLLVESVARTEYLMLRSSWAGGLRAMRVEVGP